MSEFIKKIMPNQLKNLIRRTLLRSYTHSDVNSQKSISDNNAYPEFCIKASLSSKIFSNFRRNIVYREVLEHVSFEQGNLYLSEIKKDNPWLLKEINRFRENDKYGNPRMFNYSDIGNFSPTTIRYIKVASDLINLFGNLDNEKICEIGVGYGGQCSIINCIAKPCSYTLIDLKSALMLAQTYLDNFALHSVLFYRTMNEIEEKEFDLVISNYAFTEISRGIQDIYLKRVILKAKRGYITYNEITPSSFNSYKRDELLRLIPNSRVIEEKPLTHSKNCIIVWGA